MPSHIFYEVRDKFGSQWGGESANDCVEFYRKNDSINATIWASEWEGVGEDLYQVTKAIDVTNLVLASMLMSIRREMAR